MNDLGEASYILGIKLWLDWKNRMLGLSRAPYIDKIMPKFSIHNSKNGLFSFRDGVTLFKGQCPKTHQEEEQLRAIPYALAIGSLMYVMVFFFFWTKDLSISLIKDHEHKTLTSQSIKFCKIIAICYEVTKS